MKKRISLLLLAFAICKSFVAFGQVNTSAKPAEKPAFAYLLATSDLDVNIKVLNNQNSYTVRTTDELVKIGLDAGDNIIKVTPLDGGKDGYTVTKTADKPGNIAFRADVAARRLEQQMASRLEEESRLKTLEKERQGIFDYSFENIDKRTIWGEAPDKSIEYALLPKGAPNNKIFAELEIFHGDKQILKGEKFAYDFISDLFNTPLYDDEMKNKLNLLKSKIFFIDFGNGFGDNGNMFSVKIESNRENIEKVLALVSNMLRHPLFSEEIFQKKKEDKLRYEIDQKQHPNCRSMVSYVFDQMYNSHSKDIPNYEISASEDINTLSELNLDDVKNVYKDFMGMTNARITLVGDFDLDSLRETILKEFSGWESPRQIKKLAKPKATCVEITDDKTIFIPDESKVAKEIYFPVGIDDSDADFDGLSCAVDIVRQRIINSLKNRTFSCGGRFMHNIYLSSCYIHAEVSDCNLDCANNVLTIFKNEFNNLESFPITAEELEFRKNEILEWYQISDDKKLEGWLSTSFDKGKSLKHRSLDKSKLLTLSINKINSIVDKYINPYNFGTIQAGNVKP